MEKNRGKDRAIAGVRSNRCEENLQRRLGKNRRTKRGLKKKTSDFKKEGPTTLDPKDRLGKLNEGPSEELDEMSSTYGCKYPHIDTSWDGEN